MIIMAGIISSLPNMFVSAYTNLIDGSFIGIVLFVIYVIIYLSIIVGIVYFQIAERRIPIQYANKSMSMGSNQSYIPLKLNSSNVMPVIIASAILSIPSVVVKFINNDSVANFINNWLAMNKPLGFTLYIIFILLFSFFYAFIQLKPKEIAENLQKNGGYIPAVRPGKDTEEYLNKVIKRITFVGAFALSFLAALPIVFQMIAKDLPSSVSLGGTGLLIVVGVALETARQLEGELSMRTYTKGRKR
jgi:Preprotein translocase subunit SecY